MPRKNIYICYYYSLFQTPSLVVVVFYRFIATVQRPPTRISQPMNPENPEKEQESITVVDFKNVTLNNDSESEDEFVNIVVPIFEHADREVTKSAVREMLSKSTELRQKAETKFKGKQGVLDADAADACM